MNTAALVFAIFTLTLAGAPIVHAPKEPVVQERLETLIAEDARECVGRSEGNQTWCRERAERKILSAKNR